MFPEMHKDKAYTVTIPAVEPVEVRGNDICGRAVLSTRSFLLKLVTSNGKILKVVCTLTAIILYHVYLAIVVSRTVNNESIEWCDGSGFLFILTALVYWGLFYYALKIFLGPKIRRGVAPLKKSLQPLALTRFTGEIFTSLIVVAITSYIVYDAWGEKQRLISAGGIVVIVAIGLVISKHPDHIRWRSVVSGICLQLLLGLVILRWPRGRDASLCISEKVKNFLDFSDAGSGFVYGYLATGFNQTLSNGDTVDLPALIAFKPLSVIFFFNFVMGFLHHYGILMWIVEKVGWALEMVIGTAAVESMGAAANVFLGQSEVLLMNKPFLPHLTKSELTALIAAGLATVAGAEYGLLMSFGINASFLISASVMAAPASLALSKLIYPETETSVTTASELKALNTRTSKSALDAAARGATEAVILIGTIIANLVAFIATVAFLNAVLAWLGSLVGVHLSFEMILGKLFIPLAYITGVSTNETEDMAILLGLKTTINEVVAYRKMVSPEMAHLSMRTKVIATHALCSFANFGSVGIQLGAVSYLIPERRKDIISTIWFSFIIAGLCGVLNACVAGALITDLK